ncbi:MAG: radical SAM protein [bacterium]
MDKNNIFKLKNNDFKNYCGDFSEMISNMYQVLSTKQIQDVNEKSKQHVYVVNDKPYVVIDSEETKITIGENYNYVFNKINGDFKRWGKTLDDDPPFSPIGPELLDLEISINGCPNNCNFCYKNNKNIPATNMSFDTFKHIVNMMPKGLTQIAFGITGIQTNPDFIKMMQYCRQIGIIPNFTLSGIDITDKIAEKCSQLIGALAVSAYETDKNICYDTVKKFTDLGVTQTNIHLMVSEETLDFVYEVLNDRLTDERLQDMNAVVFLGVKPKGRAKSNYHSLSTEKYKELIEFCFRHKFNIGFDSCSAPKFEHAITLMELPVEKKKQLIECSESCESSLFSSYINVFGQYWHCSFAENEKGQNCVDVISVNDFLSNVWHSKAVKNFRKKSLNTMENGCRLCHVFQEINP